MDQDTQTRSQHDPDTCDQEAQPTSQEAAGEVNATPAEGEDASAPQTVETVGAGD